MRVKRTHSSLFCEPGTKPGANSATIWSAQITPATVKIMLQNSKKPQIRPNVLAAAERPFNKSPEKIGTKAEDNAPSPRTLRSKLGILKATKNASAKVPDPKRRATNKSRTKPSNLLTNVNELTTLVPLTRVLPAF